MIVKNLLDKKSPTVFANICVIAKLAFGDTGMTFNNFPWMCKAKNSVLVRC